jgi:hypothetical protein
MLSLSKHLHFSFRINADPSTAFVPHFGQDDDLHHTPICPRPNPIK